MPPKRKQREDYTFQFQRLPRKLQIRVLQQVDDLGSLRNLLSLPPVRQNLEEFLCAVTDNENKKLSFFNDLKDVVEPLSWTEFVAKEASKERPPPSFSTTDDEKIYLVEFDASTFDRDQILQTLKGKCTFAYMKCVRKPRSGSKEEEPLSKVRFAACARALKDAGCQAAYFHTPTKNYVLTSIDSEKEEDNSFEGIGLPWPKNSSFEHVHSLYIKDPIYEIQEFGSDDLQPLVVEDSLGMITIAGSFEDEDYREGKAVLERHRQLLETADVLGVASNGNERLCVENFTFKATGSISRIVSLKNVRFTSTGMFKLYMASDDHKTSEIEDVTFKDSYRLEIEVEGAFPKFKSIEGSKIRELAFTQARGNSTKVGVLDEMDSLELSEFVSFVRYLTLERATVPVLGYFLPGALDNIKALSIRDITRSPYYVPSTRLVPHKGTITLPNLTRLAFTSRIPMKDQVFDFNKFAEWFEMPKLENLVISTTYKGISLKQIAALFPQIKTLNIENTEMDEQIEGIFPASVSKSRIDVFNNLVSLVMETGHHRNSFKGVTFPSLLTLRLRLVHKELEGGIFSPMMPLLRNIELMDAYADDDYEVSKLSPDWRLTIRGLPSMEKIRSRAFLPQLRLVDCFDMISIRMDYQGYPIKKIESNKPLDILQELVYVNEKGRPCHNFECPRDCFVSVRLPAYYDDYDEEDEPLSEWDEDFDNLEDSKNHRTTGVFPVDDFKKFASGIAGLGTGMFNETDANYTNFDSKKAAAAKNPLSYLIESIIPDQEKRWLLESMKSYSELLINTNVNKIYSNIVKSTPGFSNVNVDDPISNEIKETLAKAIQNVLKDPKIRASLKLFQHELKNTKDADSILPDSILSGSVGQNIEDRIQKATEELEEELLASPRLREQIYSLYASLLAPPSSATDTIKPAIEASESHQPKEKKKKNGNKKKKHKSKPKSVPQIQAASDYASPSSSDFGVFSNDISLQTPDTTLEEVDEVLRQIDDLGID